VLNQKVEEISVLTKGRGFYEITDSIQHFVAASGFHEGLLTVPRLIHLILGRR